ncbi:hypothetical protein H920_14813 [Fukomys damarensis]|uniref:Uncharacterized protein n=1 Tax=Fukomys damarensis TaxID=885580 RepID=A0A091CVF8_FUKDA|nr:hypothetical protein H920_14813 [Fukomys damarensis]
MAEAPAELTIWSSPATARLLGTVALLGQPVPVSDSGWKCRSQEIAEGLWSSKLRPTRLRISQSKDSQYPRLSNLSPAPNAWSLPGTPRRREKTHAGDGGHLSQLQRRSATSDTVLPPLAMGGARQARGGGDEEEEEEEGEQRKWPS